MKAYTNIKEFQLPTSSATQNVELMIALVGIIEKLSETTKPESPIEAGELTKEEVIGLATNVFAIESAIGIAAKDPSRFESYSRTMTMKLKKIYEQLKKREIEIINHTGEAYFDTMKVEVLSFDKSPDIEKPTITETIEPTIYYNGEMIKIGKVIVTKNN